MFHDDESASCVLRLKALVLALPPSATLLLVGDVDRACRNLCH